ncbi:hypothetical protein D3C77_446750 [compost metagenome]
MQRDIEQGHIAAYLVQIILQPAKISAPEFPDREHFFACAGAHVSYEILHETIFNMLDRIEPESVEIQRIGIPYAPILDLVHNIRVIEVDILAH